MIQLDYIISSEWRSDWAAVNWRDAPEAELRYSVFLGDVVFKIGEADFSTDWGWVPIIDFAVGLAIVGEDLSMQRSRVFDFTESDAEIRFERSEELVTVSANYRIMAATVEFQALRTATSRFVCRVLEDLEATYSSVRENKICADWKELYCSRR